MITDLSTDNENLYAAPPPTATPVDPEQSQPAWI